MYSRIYIREDPTCKFSMYSSTKFSRSTAVSGAQVLESLCKKATEAEPKACFETRAVIFLKIQ